MFAHIILRETSLKGCFDFIAGKPFIMENSPRIEIEKYWKDENAYDITFQIENDGVFPLGQIISSFPAGFGTICISRRDGYVEFVGTNRLYQMNMDHALKPGDLTFIELRIEADQLDELPEQSELLL